MKNGTGDRASAHILLGTSGRTCMDCKSRSVAARPRRRAVRCRRMAGCVPELFIAERDAQTRARPSAPARPGRDGRPDRLRRWRRVPRLSGATRCSIQGQQSLALMLHAPAGSRTRPSSSGPTMVPALQPARSTVTRDREKMSDFMSAPPLGLAPARRETLCRRWRVTTIDNVHRSPLIIRYSAQ